jgi:hypothetical protein
LLDAILMSHRTDTFSNRHALPFRTAEPLLLPDEVLEFIQSGVSIIVGVVGADGRAKAGRALAARVITGGTIRLIFTEDGNASILLTARSGGPIAVTFSAPMSHRTIQLKATSSRAEQFEPDDQKCLERQMDAFAEALRAVGHPASFVQAFCEGRLANLVALSFSPYAAFEQTPGPGAGREL